MMILLAGLVVFLGVHCIQVLGLKSGLVARLGEGGYKGVYSVFSLIGLVLLIWGYGLARAEGPPVLYVPPAWLGHVAALLMVFAFILFAATRLPGHIKARAKHPTFAAVKIWAFAHLLVNGDLASIVLFGSFLAWAVVGRISAKRRPGEEARDVAAVAAARPKYDAIAVAVGLVLYVAFAFWLHAPLIGVPAVLV